MLCKTFSVLGEVVESGVDALIAIPISNNDWTFLPEDQRFPRLIEYGWVLGQFCVLNLVLYGMFALGFSVFLPDFSNLSFSKRIYTLKNLTKSLLLCVFAFSTLPALWGVVKYDHWDNYEMFFWGCVYVSTDLSGLMWVPDLSNATKIHHIIVCILGTLNAFSDYTQRGLHQALLTLTYFSAVPYIVNTYLGLRHLEDKTIQNSLISSCFYVYTFSILLNFWVQHMYIFYLIPGGVTWIKIGYLVAYYNILRDDLHLMGYFRYKSDRALQKQTTTVDSESSDMSNRYSVNWEYLLHLLNRSPFLRDRRKSKQMSSASGTSAAASAGGDDMSETSEVQEIE